MTKQNKIPKTSSSSGVINDNASQNAKIQAYQKKLVEKADKQVGKIEKEIEELEQI